MPDPSPTTQAEKSYFAGLGETRAFVIVLTVYIITHFVLSLLLSSTLGTDDVEQAIMGQSWEWGYHVNQPPLYTWLQYGLYQAVGVTLYAHALLKYSLLFATYLFLYLAARVLGMDARMAALSSFSLSLIYVIGYGMHQGYTHTALLCALVATSFWLFLHWLRSGSVATYAGLGFLVGLGLLSKYNFAVFVAGWLIAGMSYAPMRQRLASPRMLWTVAIALVLVTPHGAWLLEHYEWDYFLKATAAAGTGEGPYLVVIGRSLWSLLEGALLFLSPLWLFLLVLFPQAWQRLANDDTQLDAYRQLLGRFLAISVLLIVVLILVFELPYIKQRWLHPVLLLFPVYFFLRLGRAGSAPNRVAVYGWVLIAMALLIVIVRVGVIYVGPLLGKYTRLHVPHAALAMQLARTGFSQGTIVAGDEHIGGNLRVAFPKARVVAMNYGFYVPPTPEQQGQCLLVWNPDKGPQMREQLIGFAKERLGVSLTDTETMYTAHVRLGEAGDKWYTIEYVLLDEGSGECH